MHTNLVSINIKENIKCKSSENIRSIMLINLLEMIKNKNQEIINVNDLLQEPAFIRTYAKKYYIVNYRLNELLQTIDYATIVYSDKELLDIFIKNCSSYEIVKQFLFSSSIIEFSYFEVPNTPPIEFLSYDESEIEDFNFKQDE